LPNQGYGPWQVLNPFNIWVVVVIVTSLSFGAFVAMRLFGSERGILLSSALGGLVSSTAVTLTTARQSRSARELREGAAAGAVLASAIMGARVLILAAIIDVRIVPLLAPAAATLGVLGAAIAWFLGRRAKPALAQKQIANPFELRTALGFGAVYAVVLLLV